MALKPLLGDAVWCVVTLRMTCDRTNNRLHHKSNPDFHDVLRFGGFFGQLTNPTRQKASIVVAPQKKKNARLYREKAPCLQTDAIVIAQGSRHQPTALAKFSTPTQTRDLNARNSQSQTGHRQLLPLPTEKRDDKLQFVGLGNMCFQSNLV